MPPRGFSRTTPPKGPKSTPRSPWARPAARELANRAGPTGTLLHTTRTPPAGILPPLSSNVCFANYYWDVPSSRRELALGADGGCLVLSWDHSKSTPCLLVRHKYRHINHHAAASLPFKCAPAPLGATRHERDTTHDEDHDPAMPTANSLRRRANTTRGRVRGGTFFSGRRCRVVVGGAFG